MREGRPGTGMKSFSSVLDTEEIELVVDFIREEFVRHGARNTRYHTAENGWPDHERYNDAYPFALGELPLDTPDEQLSPLQQSGKQRFLGSCISCHDRARVNDEGPIWDSRAVSYPRRHYSHREPAIDTLSSATPYARHDVTPQLTGLNARQRLGERLYQDNCAFCHAADGTGKNWIGSFLEPHPRNLTDQRMMAGFDRKRLRGTIEDGLPGSTMPAWKSVLDTEQIEAVIDYIDIAFHPIATEDPK